MKDDKNEFGLSSRDKSPKPSGWGVNFHHTEPQRRVPCIKTFLQTFGLRLGMDVGQWSRPRAAPWDSEETQQAWLRKQDVEYRAQRNAAAKRRRQELR